MNVLEKLLSCKAREMISRALQLNNFFQHVHCRLNNFEIISVQISRAEIKLFQTDVDEG